jgi:hypothetical protein
MGLKNPSPYSAAKRPAIPKERRSWKNLKIQSRSLAAAAEEREDSEGAEEGGGGFWDYRYAGYIKTIA